MAKKQLLVLDIFQITGKEAQEIWDRSNHRWDQTFLPEFTFSKDFKIFHRSEDYIVFPSPDDWVYTMFNIVFADNLLSHEMNEGGPKWLFEVEGEMNWALLKEHFHINTLVKSYKIPTSTHFIFNLEYEGSYDDYSGATKYDLILEFDKILNLHA